MELIDKEKVVAEIEKLYKENYKFLPSDIAENVQNFKDDLLMNLDTLEVKEVDLEEKAKRYDETIERARALNNGEDIDVEAGTTTCEYISPNSKRARMRK